MLDWRHAQQDTRMSDETIQWVGRPSQWQNIGWWISCVLLLPIPWALWRAAVTHHTVYKVTEDLELYRVRDTRFQQDFFERMCGLGEIIVFTTDETSPEIRMPFIKDAEAVREKLRGLVEARRDSKRVRYLDAE